MQLVSLFSTRPGAEFTHPQACDEPTIRWLYLAMVVAACSLRCQVSRPPFGSKGRILCHIRNSLMLMTRLSKMQPVFIIFFPCEPMQLFILG